MARVIRWCARLVLALVGLVYRRKVTEMADSLPTLAGADLTRVAAEGGRDDMVLLNYDGTLVLDSTPDDIATYQIPGNWPRYVCRVAAVSSLLRRHDAESAAAVLNDQMARQFALEAMTGPWSTPTPAPPGNAPVRIGQTAVTITGV